MAPLKGALNFRYRIWSACNELTPPIDAATSAALYPYSRYVALRYTASRIHAFHLAELGEDRLAWKDWSRYRDRLRALRDMGEKGFERLLAGEG